MSGLARLETTINHVLGPLADAANAVVFAKAGVGPVQIPIVVALLALASLSITIWLGFINIGGLRQGFRLVRGDFADAAAKGEVSQFGALSAALAGTLGVGNVAGVALAISVGGPGAVFWMTATGLFGMSLKFAECALAVKYRRIGTDGVVSGGPMHYLPIAFAKIGLRPVGIGLAIVFSLATLLACTSLFQVNQAFVQVRAVTGLQSPLVFGGLFAVLIGLVILGGMKTIAQVCTRLVPAMVAVYFLAAGTVIVAKAAVLPSVFMAILQGAFSSAAFSGGLLGAVVVGVQRAVFAGESGLGSSAIAHAAAKTDEPVSEGLVALFEPFVATVFVCNLTALVILAAGTSPPLGKAGGVEIASAAFQTVLPWFAPALALLVALLAYKTVIAWAYYGERAWGWLVGEGRKRRALFRIGFLAALVVAPVLTPGEAIRFIDAMVFAMAIPNLMALALFAPELRRDLLDYRRRSAADRQTRRTAPTAEGLQPLGAASVLPAEPG
jgi:AGCS family alanine or glycine:cation symporter